VILEALTPEIERSGRLHMEIKMRSRLCHPMEILVLVIWVARRKAL
jgi:hypothetical protein